jgi:type IV secretion system protein VirB1
MDTTTFAALALACAPAVHASTAYALAAVESNFNPYAIGVVGGSLLRQPKTQQEALVTAKQLQAEGWNFSLGLAQINVHNFARLGLTAHSALDPCTNLSAMQTVLGDCFKRAANTAKTAHAQTALRQALSCYYSGNFITGFKHGYVQRVLAAASREPGTPEPNQPALNKRAPTLPALLPSTTHPQRN